MRIVIIVVLLVGVAHADDAGAKVDTTKSAAERYFRAGAKAYAQLVEEIIRRVREENRPGAAAVQPAAPDHSAA